jgi:hypothetical protein
VSSLWQAAGIFLPALAITWFWKNKWNAPVILLGAAAVGALLLGSA